MTNGPTWATGKIGGALSFDGVDDYVHLRNFEWGGEISITTWVKYNTLKFARIIDFGNGSDADNILLGSGSNPHNEFWFHIRRAATSEKLDTSEAFHTGNWLHFIATINEQNLATIYRNGISINSGSLWQPSNLLCIKQYIGKSNWNEEYLHALLDDLRIYDRALSAEEVKPLYNMGQ